MSLFQQLFDNYNEFHVSDIESNRFSPLEFYEALIPLTNKFTLTHLGNSVEGRPIYSITIGNGSIKVLLWSQMHGNESTATRAILDILQFLNEPGSFSDTHQDFLDKLTIRLVPMLNPDGTERFQRRNALEIDINRDAREFVSPESEILKSIIGDFRPGFAFNLHDQRRFYNIKNTAKPSTIAFLAPAFNEHEDTDQSRQVAMQLIASMRSNLETAIPGQIGLYDDTFTPRAFGDYVQKTGASTILVESGWTKDDIEKEFVRKLNFCSLVSAFETIAGSRYAQLTVADYQSIPLNDEKLFDVLIRNISINSSAREHKYDIGIQRSEITVTKSTDYYSHGVISDVGDLQEWYGFEEVVGDELTVETGKLWPKTLPRCQDLSRDQAIKLLKQGYIFINTLEKSSDNYVDLPINVVPQDFVPNPWPIFEGEANLVLRLSNGEIKYILVNGFLWRVDRPLPAIVHGLWL